MLHYVVMGNIVGRLQSAFPLPQLEVIIWSLLGDARLECRSLGIRSAKTARFRVHHDEKQKEYVFWKYQELQTYITRGPREIAWTNPRCGLHEVSWYFHTRSTRELGMLHDLFYLGGKKVLPQDIFSIWTNRMLAVWYMDDGSNNANGITLNTHSFSLEDQKIIQNFLNEKYHMKPSIVKDRSCWKLAIGKNDKLSFLSIVRPHIVPSMNYKIDNPRNDLFATF